MLPRDLGHLVNNTGDAAFATNNEGVIVAGNEAAARLFGVSAEAACGRQCGDVLCGRDECGPVCSPGCSVRQALSARRRICNYDLELHTAHGRQWCNLSVLAAEVPGAPGPHAIHIVRTIAVVKRVEQVLREFATTSRSPLRDIVLTAREDQILRLLASGASTERIARELHISRATVNNHVQHILRKLNAHTRLEAVRRAEYAGLI
jgi:PAS domain S-box-containing protein